MCGPDEMILDVGPATSQALTDLINEAGTIIWNGPARRISNWDALPGARMAWPMAVASATVRGAYSIAGGGDTLAAIAKYRVGDRVSYISTGGGAFPRVPGGKTLRPVAVLEERSRNPT